MIIFADTETFPVFELNNEKSALTNPEIIELTTIPMEIPRIEGELYYYSKNFLIIIVHNIVPTGYFQYVYFIILRCLFPIFLDNVVTTSSLEHDNFSNYSDGEHDTENSALFNHELTELTNVPTEKPTIGGELLYYSKNFLIRVETIVHTDYFE